MEDLLILILQMIGQFIFELLAWWPFDCWWPSYSAPQAREPYGSIWWYCLIIAMGAAVGGASLWIFPDVLVKLGWLRIALLVISPLGSAFLAKTLAEIAAKKDTMEDPNSHFWFAFCFSVGLVLVRFTFAHRRG